ncbi:MAG TPA: DUF3060 domain-containing protein [Candidatus Xenobia bacterium]
MNLRSFLGPALALALTSVALAVPGDISWVTKLPHVSLISSADNAAYPGQVETVWSVTGDPNQTWSDFRTALAQHGWHVRSSADASTGGIMTHTLTADHQGHSLQGAITGLPALGTKLAVQWRSDEGLVATGGNVPAQVDVPTGEPAAGNNPVYNINDNHQDLHLKCHNSTVNLDGNNNSVECLGTCATANLNGNNNVVVFTGRVSTINVLGNHNSVKWSKTANPTPPVINEMGNQNVVTRF